MRRVSRRLTQKPSFYQIHIVARDSGTERGKDVYDAERRDTRRACHRAERPIMWGKKRGQMHGTATEIARAITAGLQGSLAAIRSLRATFPGLWRVQSDILCSPTSGGERGVDGRSPTWRTWMETSMTGFIGQKSDAEDFVRLCALLRINVHLCATLAKFDHCCAILSDFVHSRVLLIDFVRLCAGRP